MTPRSLAIALLTCCTPCALLAQSMDLPPAEQVNQALNRHPTVEAATERVAAARAHSGMLARGPHEVTLSGSYVRRNVEGFGGRDEFDATVTRAFRLPGKASLDREAGALEVEVAENRMEDARHQTALILSGLWYDWLTAGSQYRNDGDTVSGLEQALVALRRRVALRDASELDLDQASAALAQARAQAAASRAAKEQTRVTLAATFPDLPLPVEPPELAIPDLAPQGLERMRDLVIERSHEIRAADREAQRLGVVSQRVRADRIADPSFGIRVFSEQGGLEKGAGVVASIPLGGGYRRGAADQAAAEANAARLELANIQRNIGAVADSDLSNSRTRFEAWRSAEASARSSLDAVRRTERGYQLGQIDLAELLYARRQANDARRYEIDARSQADRALLKLQIDSHSIWTPDEEKGHGE